MPKTKKTSNEHEKELLSLKKKAQPLADKNLIIEKLPGYFLLVSLIAALAALLWILWPFIAVILIAAVLTVTFYPLYQKILAGLKGYKRTSSLISCLIVIVVIVLPLTLFILYFASVAVRTYQVVQERINSGAYDQYFNYLNVEFLESIKQEISPVVDVDDLDLKSTILNWAGSLSNFLFTQTLQFVEAFSSLLFGFVLMVFSMYYFFKDGESIVDRLRFLSPLPEIYENELFRKLNSMVSAIMVGVFLTAAVQGFLGGVGFAIIGLPSPIFWGAAMGFFSLLPLFGTSLIWFPAAIILAINGEYYSALFIAIWGFLLVGAVDNVLRPYLIGGKAHTYPLMTFFVVLGGIFTMGFKGLVFGPLILMIVLSLLHIYEAEYIQLLKK